MALDLVDYEQKARELVKEYQSIFDRIVEYRSLVGAFKNEE